MQIDAKGLTYVYNPKSPFAGKALNGVDLTIREGEFSGSSDIRAAENLLLSSTSTRSSA